MQLNWDKLIEDIQNFLISWNRRNLTFNGKIIVLKTLVMSRCNYLLQCISATQGIIAKIERLLFKFLWNDKNEKIKRKQLTQNYANGGLNMVDVTTQLQTFKIKWVNRLISQDDMNWKIIPKIYFAKYGNHLQAYENKLFGEINS